MAEHGRRVANRLTRIGWRGYVLPILRIGQGFSLTDQHLLICSSACAKFVPIDQPNNTVVTGLQFGSPLRIVTANRGGTVRENASYLLDGRALS